jgi:hypothetical protein
MQYPHWLMVVGGVLVVLGFIGFAFHKNNAQSGENNLGHEAAPPEEGAQTRNGLTKRPAEFREDRVDLAKAKK